MWGVVEYDVEDVKELLRDMGTFYDEPKLADLIDAVTFGVIMAGITVMVCAGFVAKPVRRAWRFFDNLMQGARRPW